MHLTQILWNIFHNETGLYRFYCATLYVETFSVDIFIGGLTLQFNQANLWFDKLSVLWENSHTFKIFLTCFEYERNAENTGCYIILRLNFSRVISSWCVDVYGKIAAHLMPRFPAVCWWDEYCIKMPQIAQCYGLSFLKLLENWFRLHLIEIACTHLQCYCLSPS